MIGMIIAGHGQWASGMLDAIRLLAGKPEHVTAVNFLQEDTSDDFRDKLKTEIEAFRNCESIAVFTDILESTPYREALDLKQEYQGTMDIEVLSGSNLGMLMQGNIARSYIHDLSTFSEMCMNEGKRHITCASEEERKD